jgi:4-hydroxybenzoate polyprenyltransferase
LLTHVNPFRRKKMLGLNKRISLERYCNLLFKLFYFLVREYAFGGHIFGTFVVGMILVFGFISGEPLNLTLLLVAYFMPLVIYVYGSYKHIEEDRLTNPERVHYLESRLKYHKIIMGVYVALLIGLIVFSGQSIGEILVFVTILVGGGLLYEISFKSLTKYIPAFKNIWVTLEGTLAATFLLIIYNKHPVTEFTVLVFTFIFLKILTNNIFCDIKDIKTDSEKGLKTVPVLIGVDNTTILLCLMSIISLIPLILGVHYQIMPKFVLLFVIFLIYDVYIIFSYYGTNKKKWYKYVFISDLEFTLWPVIIIPLIWIIQNIR